MTTVLVVDDQVLVSAGLRSILEAEADLTVVGEAADGAEAVRKARELVPDVVLMDVRMPVMDGLRATELITASGRSQVLVLTTFDLDEYVYRALRAGASGFLLKDTPRPQLVAGVRAVACGESLLAPAVTRRLIERYLGETAHAEAAATRLERLTVREREVLVLIAHGLSNSEIAERLVLSLTTVKTHVASVLRKLGLRDRVQAVVLAYECRLVTSSARRQE